MISAIASIWGGGGTAQAQFSGTGNAASRSINHPFTSSQPFEEEAETHSNRAAPTQRKLQIVLREGTFIGPLRGRFVVRGQRWSFLVDEALASSDVGKSTWIDDGLAREILPDQDTLLGRPRTPATTILETQGEPYSLRSHRLGAAATGSARPTFASMLVNENLMLDRIARAIEEDPHDDYWTITGTVTEFQDENRLLVLTANRARRDREPAF